MLVRTFCLFLVAALVCCFCVSAQDLGTAPKKCDGCAKKCDKAKIKVACIIKDDVMVLLTKKQYKYLKAHFAMQPKKAKKARLYLSKKQKEGLSKLLKLCPTKFKKAVYVTKPVLCPKTKLHFWKFPKAKATAILLVKAKKNKSKTG